MSIFLYIVVFSFIGSVVSLMGGVLLLFFKQGTLKASHLLASFAAGALLATAFFDLLPEAFEMAPDRNIFGWALAGFMVFFIFERFLSWFHHHHDQDEHDTVTGKPVVALIVFGDSLHNFIDGIVIAGAFLVDIRLGSITALATAAHEIPQEIGDFGILLSKGVPKSKVLLYNFLSALATMVAATLTYFVGNAFQGLLPIFLAATAGFFIYIAASDLIPEIHHEKRKGFAFYETLLLIIGILVVWGGIAVLEPPKAPPREVQHTQVMNV